MPKPPVKEIVAAQRKFFETGQTRSIEFRISALKSLRKALIANEDFVLEALNRDLRKSSIESYVTEIGIILYEINYALKNIKNWSKPRKVKTPAAVLPARSQIRPEPYGVALIISPWNYPFNLTFVPLVGAIAAGNCCVIKPSEISEASSDATRKIISETFDEAYITVVEGGADTAGSLLDQRFDKIFFTGSPAVGKIVMEKAARHLANISLELGGKNPCIVDKNVNIDVAAKRILWGKLLNAGQTCVAPDYLLVHREIKEELYASLKKWLSAFFPSGQKNSPDLARIINEEHFRRLKNYLAEGTIVAGGDSDEAELFIALTIIELTDHESPLMEEEIFGPVLPVIGYSEPEDLEKIIAHNPNPLALYLFSGSPEVAEHVINRIPFGGGCVNDTIFQIANNNLPYGGRGKSGLGSYQGKYSFEAFSHRKSIVSRGFRFDPGFKYPPFKNSHADFVRKLLHKWAGK